MNITITVDDITAEQLVAIGQALGMDQPAIRPVGASLEIESPAEPPAPATPAEPPAPATPAEPPAGEVELDSEGLPWDSRIHSREKTKNKDETWRVKRGKPPETVAQVKAELRATMGAEPAPTPAPATTPAEPAEPPATTAGHPAEGMTFPVFMQTATAAGIDSAALLEACKKHDIASTALLASRPDMIPTIYDEVFRG